MGNVERIGMRFPTIEDYRKLRPKDGRLAGGKAPQPHWAGVCSGLVSVVTVTFNSVGSVERTIRSIVEQRYPMVEYIVVDGGSKDGTVERLRKWENYIDLWISEKDDGISDAFNKGIAMAKGEFVMIVNSDDWLEMDHLAIAVEALQSSDADYAFGDLIVHESDESVIGSLRGEAGYSKRIRHVMPFINHPTVVCRRAAYMEYGLFNTQLHHAMDYEWFLRVSIRGGRGTYVPGLMSHMTLNGRSDRSFTRSLAEVRDASIAYGYPVFLAWVRFLARLFKGYARRGIERFLPKAACDVLRRAFNGAFVPP